MSPYLIIGGNVIPVRARLDLSQRLEPLAGETRRRLADGSLFSMSRWGRWRTTIQGGGWIPTPLLLMDFSQQYEIHCVQPVSIPLGEQLPERWRERTDIPSTKIFDEHGGVFRLVYPILTVRSGPPVYLLGINSTWELSAEEV